MPYVPVFQAQSQQIRYYLCAENVKCSKHWRQTWSTKAKAQEDDILLLYHRHWIWSQNLTLKLKRSMAEKKVVSRGLAKVITSPKSPLTRCGSVEIVQRWILVTASVLMRRLNCANIFIKLSLFRFPHDARPFQSVYQAWAKGGFTKCQILYSFVKWAFLKRKPVSFRFQKLLGSHEVIVLTCSEGKEMSCSPIGWWGYFAL